MLMALAFRNKVSGR